MKHLIKRLNQMKVKVLFLLPFCLLTFLPLNAQVGTWQAYMAYHDVQQICKAGDYLFVLASNDLYQYNLNDHSITTFDKISGLNDTYITLIAWNPQVKRLIIIYDNSNIDLMDTSGNVTNISALYLKSMTDDKTVEKITIDGIYAYLHCSFGYVKVNMKNAEIADTYRPNHPEYPTSLPEYDANQDFDTYLPIVSTLNLGGPKYNYFFEIQFLNNRLYTTGGQYSSMSSRNNPGTVQVWDGNDWTIYQDELNSITGYSYKDMDCLAVDPADENHVFAAGRTGLYEFRNGKYVSHFNTDNTTGMLENAVDHGKVLGNNYCIVNGLTFDNKGNLWILNSQTKNRSILEYTQNNQWKDHNSKNLYHEDHTFSQMRCAMIDSRGLLWFVNDHWNTPALICYNIENDEVNVYKNFVNQDGTTYTVYYVHCVTEDLEGNIWIGTNQGPFYVEKDQIGQSSITFNQVKVPRNDGSNYADYLLSGVDISSIAIDAGGRKWFGTYGNGVYLISSDNLTQISHFQTDDSDILSDNINSIAINHQKGIVYFATDKGLCSYTSDATTVSEEMTKDNVYAYPNPVTPDFTGLITIVGLSLNADVKITSSNGALIAEGRSNGGSFTWDGRDKQGRRVASGIYMVITATSDGRKGTVCKIAII